MLSRQISKSRLATEQHGKPQGDRDERTTSVGSSNGSGIKVKGMRSANFESKDPTTSKPMLIALWMRRDIQAIGTLKPKEGASPMLNPPQLAAFSGRVDDLIAAYLGMHKIDMLVLPLPYSQLLKIFSMFFVYSAPFVLAPTVGIFTPFVSLFLAAGYFGLDQLGAELECPFGKDDNDLPLLTFGQDLCRNLDTLVRGSARGLQRQRERKARYQKEEQPKAKGEYDLNPEFGDVSRLSSGLKASADLRARGLSAAVDHSLDLEVPDDEAPAPAPEPACRAFVKALSASGGRCRPPQQCPRSVGSRWIRHQRRRRSEPLQHQHRHLQRRRRWFCWRMWWQTRARL